MSAPSAAPDFLVSDDDETRAVLRRRLVSLLLTGSGKVVVSTAYLGDFPLLDDRRGLLSSLTGRTFSNLTFFDLLELLTQRGIDVEVHCSQSSMDQNPQTKAAVQDVRARKDIKVVAQDDRRNRDHRKVIETPSLRLVGSANLTRAGFHSNTEATAVMRLVPR